MGLLAFVAAPGLFQAAYGHLSWKDGFSLLTQEIQPRLKKANAIWFFRCLWTSSLCDWKMAPGPLLLKLGLRPAASLPSELVRDDFPGFYSRHGKAEFAASLAPQVTHILNPAGGENMVWNSLWVL